MRLALLVAPLLLASCAAPRISAIHPPLELTTCASEPVAPDIPNIDWTSDATIRATVLTRDKLVLDAFLAERAWGGDCQAKVAGVKAWGEALP